ncbi:MAG: hypothetical protein ACHQT8_04265 [Chlamydiales bacterium]
MTAQLSFSKKVGIHALVGAGIGAAVAPLAGISIVAGWCIGGVAGAVRAFAMGHFGEYLVTHHSRSRRVFTFTEVGPDSVSRVEVNPLIRIPAELVALAVGVVIPALGAAWVGSSIVTTCLVGGSAGFVGKYLAHWCISSCSQSRQNGV